MKLIAKDIVGPNAISMQSGKILYDKIFEQLASGGQVEIDFIDVDIFASPFFNASIGLLLRDVSIDELQKNLKFNNLSDVGRQLLNHVIKNALIFYDTETNVAEMLQSINKNPENN